MECYLIRRIRYYFSVKLRKNGGKTRAAAQIAIAAAKNLSKSLVMKIRFHVATLCCDVLELRGQVIYPRRQLQTLLHVSAGRP